MPAPESNHAEEIRRDVHEAIEGLADRLVGRVYSPRIKLLNIQQVCEATGLADRTIFGKVRDGTFPRPIEGLGKNMWRESTLIRWMDAHDPDCRREWTRHS